ncbi:hypothetical protein PR048_016774 [Dryococelus australis]|uniref:Uncharacterized protein n=1 Tax=Dryococelus australis TaxID=614101 RepID=A0ABQ9H7M2_9NEOP|nr:hypothetical protein PR048_016774 [Dryococelus australis]
MVPCTVLVCTLAQLFSAPMIGLCSAPGLSFIQDSIPLLISRMSLCQTWIETGHFPNVWMPCCTNFYNTYLSRQDEIAERYFWPSTPYIGDILPQTFNYDLAGPPCACLHVCYEAEESDRPEVNSYKILCQKTKIINEDCFLPYNPVPWRLKLASDTCCAENADVGTMESLRPSLTDWAAS